VTSIVRESVPIRFHPFFSEIIGAFSSAVRAYPVMVTSKSSFAIKMYPFPGSSVESVDAVGLLKWCEFQVVPS